MANAVPATTKADDKMPPAALIAELSQKKAAEVGQRAVKAELSNAAEDTLGLIAKPLRDNETIVHEDGKVYRKRPASRPDTFFMKRIA